MAKLEIPINIDWNDIRKALEERDIVEVVRCENCAHYIRHDKRCGKLNHGVGTSFYCADGERRE